MFHKKAHRNFVLTHISRQAAKSIFIQQYRLAFGSSETFGCFQTALAWVIDMIGCFPRCLSGCERLIYRSGFLYLNLLYRVHKDCLCYSELDI